MSTQLEVNRFETVRDEPRAITIKREEDKIFRYLYRRGQWQKQESSGWVDIRQEELFYG